MKKMTSLLLAVSLIVAILSTCYAYNGKVSTIRNDEVVTQFKEYKIGDSDIVVPCAKTYADILNKLGLFRGSHKGYELEKPVTRAEAITMVLRMVGEEKEALSSNHLQMFSDVDTSHWAFNNIGYAAHKGYIKGTSATTFAPERGVTGKEFVKMLLSAMGYKDITMENAYELGVKYGLLDNNYSKLAVSTNGYQLLRNDMVNICYSSLYAKTPDGRSLKEVLADKGVIDINDLDKGFAWNLNKLMPKDKNYTFSPLSIKMAMAMAATGADGQTKTEILQVLNIEDLDGFNESMRQLIKTYSEGDDLQLNIANSLWLNTDYYKDVKFEEAYKDMIANYYNATSQEVDNTNAVEKINSWVKDKTNGKITEIISDSDFLACILNAVYFKGEWAVQFEEEATKKANFTDRNGKVTQTDFMNMTGYFNYYEDPSVQMLELPYKGRKASMYIAIPASRDVNFSKGIENMERKRVQISMPKFKTEFAVTLNDILTEMGIQTAFDKNKADFKKMFTQVVENIYISDVIHKTFINVDENGTEAAAATGIVIDVTSIPTEEPIVFKADKPFTYFIRDNANGEILFMGEYAYIE